MRKHYPLDPVTGAENAALLPWSDGIPTTGTPGSYPGQALVTDAEAELLTAVDLAGLPRSGTDLTQVAQALSIGIFLNTFTGTANALTATLPGSVTIPALVPGMRFAGAIGLNANTGAATLSLAGFASVPGAKPITRRDGVTQVQAGDLPAGGYVTLVWDGASFRIAGIVPSDIMTQIQGSTRTNLTINTTLYVRADSTATSPTGQTNTPGDAFATIAAAYLYAAQRYNLGVFTVAICLGVPGNYAGFVATNVGVSGSFAIITATSALAGYVVNLTTLTDGTQACVASQITALSVSGITLDMSTINAGSALRVLTGGQINWGNIAVKCGGNAPLASVIQHDAGSTSYRNGPVTIAGNGATLGAYSTVASNATDGGVSAPSAQSLTISNIAVANFYAITGGTVFLQQTSFAAAGVTGSRYAITDNGVLRLSGVAEVAIPGNAGGTVVKGYVDGGLGADWTTYTPALVVGAGNISGTAIGYWKKVDRQIHFHVVYSIASASGASNLTVGAPPVAPSFSAGGGGVENGTTGKALRWSIGVGAASFSVGLADATTAAGTGYQGIFSGSYATTG